MVTGASRGIGKAICEELVRHGLTVIGVAREIAEIEVASDNLFISIPSGYVILRVLSLLLTI